MRRTTARSRSSPRPQRHTAYAAALGELGLTLCLANRNREASVVVQEAVTVVREAGPATWGTLLDLADYLRRLSWCLSPLERYQESLAAAEERVSLETQLRLADPAGDPARLARALSDLGYHLTKVDQYQAAVSTTREAVMLYRQMTADEVAGAQYDLAATLDRLSFCAERAGQWPEAVTALREEVALRRHLPAREGTTDAVDLADALHNLAFLLRNGRRFAEMMPVAEEAIVRYRLLANAGLLEPLAAALIDLAKVLTVTRHFWQAWSAWAEANSIRS